MGRSATARDAATVPIDRLPGRNVTVRESLFERVMSSIALSIRRITTVRARPPGRACGNNGLISAQRRSLRSVGARFVRRRFGWLCRKGRHSTYAPASGFSKYALTIFCWIDDQIRKAIASDN